MNLNKNTRIETLEITADAEFASFMSEFMDKLFAAPAAAVSDRKSERARAATLLQTKPRITL